MAFTVYFAAEPYYKKQQKLPCFGEWIYINGTRYDVVSAQKEKGIIRVEAVFIVSKNCNHVHLSDIMQEQKEMQARYTINEIILYRLDELNKRLDRLENRLDRIETRLDKLDDKIEDVRKESRSSTRQSQIMIGSCLAIAISVIIFLATH